MRFLKWTAIVLLLLVAIYILAHTFHTCLFSHNACCAVNRSSARRLYKIQ